VPAAVDLEQHAFLGVALAATAMLGAAALAGALDARRTQNATDRRAGERDGFPLG
jgi:hypothetical protein